MQTVWLYFNPLFYSLVHLWFFSLHFATFWHGHFKPPDSYAIGVQLFDLLCCIANKFENTHTSMIQSNSAIFNSNIDQWLLFYLHKLNSMIKWPPMENHSSTLILDSKNAHFHDNPNKWMKMKMIVTFDYAINFTVICCVIDLKSRMASKLTLIVVALEITFFFFK